MNSGESKKRILVIDDSDAIHRDFRRILCPEPVASRAELDLMENEIFGEEAPLPPPKAAAPVTFELDSAFQGQEGLAKVEQAQSSGHPYALAFLDYRMPPGWNGIQTLRHLRQVAPKLRVVLCSAYSDYSWEEVLEEFGDLPELTELRKPFNTQELLTLAQRLALPKDSAAAH
jgi:CheY-like chemotaxis protein